MIFRSSCLGYLNVLLLWIGVVSGNETTNDCISNLGDILSQEGPLTTTETVLQREYILCPNTVFQTGIANQDGDIVNGQYPIVVRRNAVVKCGADGKSTNNCIITTGQYAIFLKTFDFFGDLDMYNVEFHGLTIQFMSDDADVPIIVQQNKGSVKFVDLIYSGNTAAPGFIVVQESRDDSTATATGRSGPGPRRLFQHGGASRRRLQGATDTYRTCTAEDADEDWLSLTIIDSLIENNQHTPGSDANSLIDGGTPLQITAEDGTVTTTITRTIWRNNEYDGLVPVENLLGTALLHKSCGKLTITDNCFEGNTFSGPNGIVYSDTDVVDLSDNYIDSSTGLACPFVGHIESEVGRPFKLGSCLGDFDATECLARAPTPAPTPLPVVDGFCFPGDALVQLADGNDVPMEDLRIGDKVLTENGNYEEVYSFGHRNPMTEAYFLRFNDKLEISEHHMLWVDGSFAPASSVRLGDTLRNASGEEIQVESIVKVLRQGVYSPFTLSGTIAVNGYIASNFVGFQDSGSLDVVGVKISYHWMAQRSQFPHRFAYQVLGFKQERYTSEGISTWVALPFRLSMWLMEQSKTIVTVFMVPIFCVFCLFAFLEGMVETGAVTLASIVIALTSVMVVQTRCRGNVAPTLKQNQQ